MRRPGVWLVSQDRQAQADGFARFEIDQIGESVAIAFSGRVDEIPPVGHHNTTDSNCIAGRSDACSGTNRSSIETASSGSSSFNNTWLHILVPLGTNYGSGGFWQGGWWQIQCTVGSANDTTTWSVNVVGNPVHLVPIG